MDKVASLESYASPGVLFRVNKKGTQLTQSCPEEIVLTLAPRDLEWHSGRVVGGCGDQWILGTPNHRTEALRESGFFRRGRLVGLETCDEEKCNWPQSCSVKPVGFPLSMDGNAS